MNDVVTEGHRESGFLKGLNGYLKFAYLSRFKLKESIEKCGGTGFFGSSRKIGFTGEWSR